MISVTALLFPALISAVLVFLVSSLIHMLTPWHAGDFSRLPNEEGVLAALRPFSITPGTYVAPRPSSMKEMGTPEVQAKLKLGPSVMMRVMRSGQTGMGRQLALWFVYSFVVALFAGFITSKALQPGTNYIVVFKSVAAIAFAAYAMGLWQESIWYQRPWSVTLKSTIDGVVYGCLTAGAFGWLWPR
jgi:hypothetical protein